MIAGRLLRQAWSLRRDRFGDEIEWVNPAHTAVLSATGRACALKCAHCGGRYLEHMLPLDRWPSLEGQGVKSCLVSGGCDARGVVPLCEHMDALEELSKRWPLNLHAGLVDETGVDQLSSLSPTVSFDFVTEDATIREVYGLDVAGTQFIASYEALRRRVRVVPHICIGVRGGRLSGEYDALDALAASGVDAIVFLVFVPTPGTRYAARRPPEPEEAAGVIARARLMFPDTPLRLGCMRPRGAYRDEFDGLALRAGINRVVLPSPRARIDADTLGLVASWRDECCVF